MEVIAMSKLSYQRNKKSGITYVYSIEKSYWDKEKKSPRNKQVYLGKLDAKTGEIIPSKRRHNIVKRAKSTPGITATSRVAGPYLLLEQITQKHGLDRLMKKCFAEKWRLMLSLVYFLVHKSVALSRSESWSRSCLHPFSESIASQRISELLRDVSEDERQQFLAMWLEHVLEKDYLCYDITSVSSYARHNEYTHYGYNRDNECLEQINLAMLFGQNSRLPAYYRRMPGNISDVATLKTTVKSLDFLGAARIHLILDKGFYSAGNIDELYKRSHKFTIALPTGRKWVEAYLDKHRENIVSPTNYLMTGESEALYMTTELHKWGSKHRGYLHLYYNAECAASDFDRFTRRLISYRKELLEGKPVKEHEDFYHRYLIIKKTPKRGLKITYNDEEIRKHRDCYSGFFCILSNKIKDSAEALRVYRNKDVVENCFDDLKNHLDMKRLRVHSSEAMDCRLFLQFLSLVYISTIRNTIQVDSKLKHMTTREVMEEMESLARIKYSNHYGQIFTETTPIQRHIMKAFNIELPT
jgi:transposase